MIPQNMSSTVVGDGDWFSGKIMRREEIVRILAVLVFACVTAAAWPVAASSKATVEELFNEFGLFGTWATNCAAPASPDNPHVTISMPTAGLVLEDHNLGPDYALNRYSVVAAQKVAAERLSVEVIFQPGTAGEERQKLEFQVRGGTRRTMFNQPEGGPVRVKAGVALGLGSKTPLLKKCE